MSQNDHETGAPARAAAAALPALGAIAGAVGQARPGKAALGVLVALAAAGWAVATFGLAGLVMTMMVLAGVTFALILVVTSAN